MDTVILDMDHLIRDALISKVCTQTHTLSDQGLYHFSIHTCSAVPHSILMCTCSLPKGNTTGLVWKALAKPQRNPDEHREIQLGKKVYKDADKESYCSPHTRRLFIWVWENGTCKPSQANCIWCLIRFLWCHGCQAVICTHHMSVISRRLHSDSHSKHLSLSQKSANETHSISIDLQHTDRSENYWNNRICLICVSLKRIIWFMLLWNWNGTIKKCNQEGLWSI